MIVLAFWSSRWFGAKPAEAVEAVGVISDSHCNGVHRPAEAPDATPASCIQGCLRNGAHYVFVSGDAIYTIRNPEVIDLMADAGRTVQVSGTVRQTELTLAAVTAVH